MTVALRTVVLAAWAAFFAFLWASGEGERYLGPRTQWVIPFGALALGATALAQGVLAVTRRAHTEPGHGEVVGSLVLALPILALLIVPTPELGAQAASKKRASNAMLVAQLPAPRPTAARGDTTRASFVDVAVAALSPKEGATLGLRDGARVRVHGLVIHDSDVSGTFGLARFFVSCCAADAVPVVVPVDPGRLARPPQDRWLVVSGALRRRGERLVVAAAQLDETRAPSSPYVSASDGGAATAPPVPQRAKRPAPSGERAGFAGRAANVYERYYAHCKEFTYDALAWPQRASNADEAARLFAGPPRPLQPAAYRGCVDGLNAGEARITLKELFRRAAQGGGG
jgi:uncharacterized repeat protein (TIGR03943 family)